MRRWMQCENIAGSGNDLELVRLSLCEGERIEVRGLIADASYKVATLSLGKGEAEGSRKADTTGHMKSLFDKLGLTDENAGVFDGEWRGGGAKIDKISPIDGRRLASLRTASDDDYNSAVSRAH